MKNTDEISNNEDIIDSRDVIARIEYLEGEFDSWKAEQEESAEAEGRTMEGELTVEDWSDVTEEGDELKALKSLAEEAEGYASDWRHGEALIRDSYFEDYARQLAEDVGAIPSDAQWPCTCIDWKEAAEQLSGDYTSVDFDGVSYWIR